MVYNLIPKPQNIHYSKQQIAKLDSYHIYFSNKALTILGNHIDFVMNRFQEKCKSQRSNEPDGIIAVEFDNEIKDQGYRISIRDDAIEIYFKDPPGLFYGISTIAEILNQSNQTIEALQITDFPNILHRGIQMDISRDKIPTKDTILKVIDLLSDVRFNQFQLYMQGYVFEYKKYKYLFPTETPITEAEIKEIDAYCKERFIDFIPNLNSLGHFDMWLEKPQFNDFAECPDGFLFKGLYERPAGTLDVYNNDAFLFLTELIQCLLQNYDSKYFNANLDEPFEIGMGKNIDQAKQFGSTKLYLDFILKLNEWLGTNGKEMFMWGDVIFNHPEIIDKLPKNLYILDWIYEGDASFESHAKVMKSTGLKYYLCPGTSTWSSYTGRSDNMKKNISDAVRCAIEYNAFGVMIADWGDMGHLQYLPVSYAGFVFGGAYTWNSTVEDCEVHRFMNKNIYCDASNQFSQLMYDLGNYYKLEKSNLLNTTLSFAVMCSKYRFSTYDEFKDKMYIMEKLVEGIAHENNIPFEHFYESINFQEIANYCDRIYTQMIQLGISCSDKDIILKEVENNIKMIKHGALLYHVMKDLYVADHSKTIEYFRQLYQDMDMIIKTHYELWEQRNKQGGFERSVSQLYHLYNFYKKEIKNQKVDK